MSTDLPASRVAVAPMLDWTDRHCRYFLRLLSKHMLLYTEMVTTGAILHGKRDRYLGFDPVENPVALQLGGSHPQELAECARIGADYGYQEINLNVGCPSDRVQSGRFGACLMAEPQLVADCVAAMKNAVNIPVTVKSRIGIDHNDSYEALQQFVTAIQQAGCDHLIVHARKAWLHGLSPKENREVPPLNYPMVYQLKQDFPELAMSINGGITSLEQAADHLQHVDGVMIGREAYHNSYILAEVDQRFFGETLAIPSREDIIAQLIPYIESQAQLGVQVKHITRHVLGLFQGVAGGRRWRRYLSEHAHLVDADSSILLGALNNVRSQS